MPSRDEALRARLDELFLEELGDHVERLEQGLQSLSDGLPEVSDETVAELFRYAHSLKGAAAAVGVTLVASLCNELEDSLAQVRAGSGEFDQSTLDALLRLVDRIAEAGAELGRRKQVPGADRGTRPAHAYDAPPSSGSGFAPAPRSAPEPGRDPGTVRLTGGRLDSLLAQAGELITATYRSEMFAASFLETSDHLAREVDAWHRDREILLHAVGSGGQLSPQVRDVLERIDQRTRGTATALDRLARSAGSHQAGMRGLATNFAEAVREARMVPFTEATAGLAKVVRDVCADQEKKAQLVVDAATVEVDKQLVAVLHDVLGHVVRNAVAHGIERPEQRQAAGKPTTGSVVVRAALRTDGIAVTVSDDGRGIDVERVQERAAALGLASSADGDVGLAEALFHPGLSTAEEVTGASGRGVGLDAVRAAVESTGGGVSIDSTPGRGSRVEISVPLTLSTLRVLLVRVGDDVLAMPTTAVRRLLRSTADITRLEGRDVVEVDDAVVPVGALSQVLGWAPSGDVAGDPTGMLVDSPDGSVVLMVDGLVAEREVVLRSVPRRLAGMTVLLGTSEDDDGSACLVLSPSVCARLALTAPLPRSTDEADGASRPPRVLVAEDTVTTRELERSILVGAGYDVVVAVDGQQAWDMLQVRDFDAVVSDVNMPRMDGIDLCRAIRASRRHPNLPVVLVTSLHSDADRRRGLEAGADAYLTKDGFDRAELLEALERLL